MESLILCKTTALVARDRHNMIAAIDLTSQPSEDSMDVMLPPDMTTNQEEMGPDDYDDEETVEETEHEFDEDDEEEDLEEDDDDDEDDDDEEALELDGEESFDSNTNETLDEEESEDFEVEEASQSLQALHVNLIEDDEHSISVRSGTFDEDADDEVDDSYAETQDLEEDFRAEINVPESNGEDVEAANVPNENERPEMTVAVASKREPDTLYHTLPLDNFEQLNAIEKGMIKQLETAANKKPTKRVSVRAITPPPPPPPTSSSTRIKEQPSSPIVHSHGLEFNMAEAWQRSLKSEMERNKLESKPLPRVKPGMHPIKHGRMMVGHTESRDYAIDMCDSGTFSLMSDASSVAPSAHPQLIHRNRTYRDEDVFLEDGPQSASRYNRPTPKTMDRKAAAGHGSPRSIYDELRQATHGKHAPYSDQWLEIEQSEAEEQYSRHNDYNDDATTVTYGTLEGQQEACFCLGYNVMDMILPPQQRSSKSRAMRSRRRLHVAATSRLEKVREELDEPECSYTSKDSLPRRVRSPETSESRSGQESAYRTRSIRQTQSRDPDGAYLDHYKAKR
ncbi:hypothetical protein MPSEU_000750100 [Mayamaea pseudoterrestris]|nr:hypothetical protein MPSEU_000750100 [Mayamaea pseudoterrestris]